METLKNLMLGEISVHLSEIDNMVTEWGTYRNNMITNAEISLQQLFDMYDSQLTAIKDLAQESGMDITPCLEPYQTTLTDLHKGRSENLPVCSEFSDGEMQGIKESSEYRMNALITEVEYYNYQLDRCQGGLSCISSIITEIDLAMVSMPQKLGVELDRSNNLYINLQRIIQSCVRGHIMMMQSGANSIAREASETCV